jgi:hypothetical protein
VLAILSLAASCVPPPPERPAAPAGPPREIAGELRKGDDTCTNLCDRHRFTWAAPTEVVVRAVAPELDVYVSVEGSGPRETGDFGHDSALTFTAQPGVEYEIAVNAYNYYESGPYTLQVTPAPSGEILAEERPVWVPPTPEQEEPEDTLAPRIAKLTAGWSPSGKPIAADLESLPAMRWKAKRGRCYRALVVMEAGARSNDEWSLQLLVKTSGESRGSGGGFVSGSRRIADAGGADGICPSKNGTVTLTFDHRQRMEPVSDAGTGIARVQLYEKPIRGADLDARDADEDDDYCRACMQQRLTCQQTGDRGEHETCEAQFSACLRDGGMKRSRCNP